jgi:hypothetical protein
MRIDSIARYALVGVFAVALACARNAEDEAGATGSVTTTDTGATVEVSPTTGDSDTAGTQITGDTSQGTMTDLDSTSGSGAPVRPGTTDSARMTIDTMGTAGDTAGAAGPGTGWPTDTTQGGWTTPADSSK